MKPEDILLKGRRALITGAGRGIGFSIAQTLVNFEATVLLVDKDQSLLDAALEALGSSARAYCVDVTDSAAIKALADEIGAVDILVNNVGDHLNLIKPFLDTEEEEWDAIYDINLKHIFS